MFGCGSWERDGREAESVNVIPSACEALSLAAVTAAAATSRAHSPSSLQGMRREAADSPKLWHPFFSFLSFPFLFYIKIGGGHLYKVVIFFLGGELFI